MIVQHNFFTALQNFFKNWSDCLLYNKEMFSKIKNGGHRTYFQATWFKASISAILKRHCSHRNSDDVVFLTNFEFCIIAVYMTYKFCFCKIQFLQKLNPIYPF